MESTTKFEGEYSPPSSVAVGGKMKQNQSLLERLFEKALWQFRWAVIVGVIASVMTALLMFYVSSVDTYHVVTEYVGYANLHDMAERAIVRSAAISHVVEIIDGYLLAIVLLIFAYGIYELYISRMEVGKDSEAEEHFLRIENLDSLKGRIGKVILMILIVKFFEVSLALDYSTVKELMVFAIAIGLISASFFLAESAARKSHTIHSRRSDFEKQREQLLHHSEAE